MFSSLLDPLLEGAQAGRLTPRAAELGTWSVVIPLGAAVLTALLAAPARFAAGRAVQRLGGEVVDVRWRMDADYWGTIRSTFGSVTFPWFAFRSGGATQVPARELFPLHPEVRSPEVLLEWESLLAADHPFRKAQEALRFFSQGAADVEDNTIERQAVPGRPGHPAPVAVPEGGGPPDPSPRPGGARQQDRPPHRPRLDGRARPAPLPGRDLEGRLEHEERSDERNVA